MFCEKRSDDGSKPLSYCTLKVHNDIVYRPSYYVSMAIRL